MIGVTVFVNVFSGTNMPSASVVCKAILKHSVVLIFYFLFTVMRVHVYLFLVLQHVWYHHKVPKTLNCNTCSCLR